MDRVIRLGFVKKIVGFVLAVFGLPKRIYDAYLDLRKRHRCLADSGAVLHRSSRILNNIGDRKRIVIGNGTHVYGDLLILGHGGQITIGSDCFISENTRIWSAKNISIGDRVLISHQVNVQDTDSHSLSARNRHEHYVGIVTYGHPKQLQDVKEDAITIEDDAWIGFGAAILRGVTVGRGAVVGACSVVTTDVEPFTVVAGNPARPIGNSRP